MFEQQLSLWQRLYFDHFGKVIKSLSCAKLTKDKAFRSQTVYVQLKRNQPNEKVLLSPNKSFLREGEGTVMASENRKPQSNDY